MFVPGNWYTVALVGPFMFDRVFSVEFLVSFVFAARVVIGIAFEPNAA